MFCLRFVVHFKMFHLINLSEIIVSIFVIYSCVVNCQISPCPHIFEYTFDEFNRSYGIASLPTKFGPNYIQVKFGSDQDHHQLSPAGIKGIREGFVPLSRINKSNKYKIRFPDGISSIPVLLSVILDGQEYCENTNDTPFTTILILQFHFGISEPYERMRTYQRFLGRYFVTNTSTLNQVDDTWMKSFKLNSVCGRREAQVIHTVINGRDVAPHEFPWLAALLDNDRKFFCCGSLVTDQHVISAAHCTLNKQTVFVELGKHDLENRSEDGVAQRVSQRIVNHPDYKPDTGHADISIITLSEKVTFSKMIKPICLWPWLGNYENKNHVGIFGTVAGWGKDISGEGTNTPMAADVAIVSDTECRNSHPVFANITSNTTFCAGGKNKGPCSGDSGSGFVVEVDNRWFVKGVVSTSIKAGFSSCNVNKFAVYCDVGQYLDWLDATLFPLF